MVKINERQTEILHIIPANQPVSSGEIQKILTNSVHSASFVTLKRDLAFLKKNRFIACTGSARARTYSITPLYKLMKPVQISKYFSGERRAEEIQTRFNQSIFSILQKTALLNTQERKMLQNTTDAARTRKKYVPPAIKKQELERFIIEFSWKSSRIEGNTYTLLETENLIKKHTSAKGKKIEEARMILNHKDAMTFVLSHPKKFRKLSIADIEYLHEILTKNLEISGNIRKTAVGITGTYYRPLDNLYQIQEAIKDACNTVNKIKNPFEKTIVAISLLAYIQPFEDGNKRTSRMVGNALLLAYNKLPLSYRATDEEEYKKAILLFDEQNNLSYFKELFMKQYEFVARNYFKI